MPKIRIRLVFCVIFKMPPNLIGSQYEKLIIQKLNVTLDIISDYHGHTSRFRANFAVKAGRRIQ